MILIVADRFDEQVQWLAARWERHGARILHAGDLSQSGWCFCPGSERWTGVAGGEPVGSDSALTGVLNCVPEITCDQLLHIAPQDRAYVAREMTAFLLSWQSELTCPVVNRPTPQSLMGPNWSREEWIVTAARLGVRVRTTTRATHGDLGKSSGDSLGRAHCVIVAGNRILGGTAQLQDWARSLGRAAAVQFAAFCFSPTDEPEFLAATLRPDLANPQTADALLEVFDGAHAC